MGVLYAIVFPSSVKTVFPSMPWCFLLNGDMVFLILLSMTHAFRLKLFIGYSIFKLPPGGGHFHLQGVCNTGARSQLGSIKGLNGGFTKR